MELWLLQYLIKLGYYIEGVSIFYSSLSQRATDERVEEDVLQCLLNWEGNQLVTLPPLIYCVCQY